jgi:hypothetical protein
MACRLALFCALTLIFGMAAAGCSDQKETPAVRQEQPDTSSFTFFNIGRNTVYTDAVRDDLQRQLGNDAIERRSILDLSINFPGFLEANFPLLAELNRRLNYPPGERVEHDTVKLMYRYARKKDVPFDYVAVVFSGDTRKPLLIRIHFQRDEADVVGTLKNKYGKPKIIEWNEGNGRSLFWSLDNDLLIVSLVPDQFGRPEYQVLIYFVDNIQTLVKMEETARTERKQDQMRTGSKAF